MTNHPGRQRGDDDEPQSIEELAASVPAVQEMADEIAAKLPPQAPPGLSPNGHTPTARLMEALPQMLFQAFAAALSQIQVQTAQHMCSACIIERIAWEHAHRAEMDAAIAAAGSPQADLTPFLPEALRPGAPRGMPGVANGITTYQGAEVCPPHLAQAAGVQAGRSTIIPVAAALNPAMLRQLAGTR